MLLFLIPFLVQVAILIFYVIPGKFAVYGSNDDGLIASFSVDNSLSTDKDNWIFIKSLISMPVTLLQEMFPSIGMYGLLLAGTIIISISAIFPLVYFVSRIYIKVLLIVIIAVTFSIFFMFSIIAPTYTGAAIYAGASGFAILLFLFRNNSKNNVDLLILASLLLSISYLIRLESFLLTFGFFLSIFIFHLILSKQFKHNRQIVIIPGMFLFFVFIINFFLDQSNYKKNDWQMYLALNEHRHAIQLRAAEYALENNLTEINWSESDYVMFKKFSLADPNKLNENALITAFKATESTRGIGALTSANLKNEAIFINYSYSGYYWMLIVVLFSLSALFVGLGIKNLIFLLYTIFILIISISINYIFAVSYHLPDRLTFNFIFLTLVALFVIAISEYSLSKKNDLKYIGLSLFVTILLVVNVNESFPDEFYARAEFQKNNIKIFKEQRKSLMATNTNSYFVATGSRIRYAWQNPYFSYKNPAKSNNLIISGWHNLSPIWNTQVRQKGLDPNKFHQEFFKNENLYWIDDDGAKSLLEDFHQQYTTEEVIIEDVGYLGSEFYRILQISTQK
jgi:hypothetical protein